MTREEAIAYFKRHIDLYCVTGICREAEEMAIKALNQEPCDDATSRQAVIDMCKKEIDHISKNWQNYHSPSEAKSGFAYIATNIYDLPPVNPQPKSGHWIGIDEEPHEDYECDKCGYVVSTYAANIEPHTEYKYCPNCGAKMEEVGE
jgi:hypothetical protein